MLSAAGLLLRSFERLLDRDPGFSRQPMLTFHVDPPFSKYNNVSQTALFYRRSLEELQRMPGVQAVAQNHSLPLAPNQNYGKPTIILDGQSESEQLQNPFVNVQIVSPNYFEVMEVPLRRGRAFTVDDREGTQLVAIVSEPLARRLFGSVDPVGRRLRFVGLLGALDAKQEAWFIVAGVAGGVRSETLLGEHSMDLYLSNQQQFAGDTFFAMRSRGDLSQLAAAVPAVIQQVDPEQALFDMMPMQQKMEATV